MKNSENVFSGIKLQKLEIKNQKIFVLKEVGELKIEPDQLTFTTPQQTITIQNITKIQAIRDRPTPAQAIGILLIFLLLNLLVCWRPIEDRIAGMLSISVAFLLMWCFERKWILIEYLNASNHSQKVYLVDPSQYLIQQRELVKAIKNKLTMIA